MAFCFFFSGIFIHAKEILLRSQRKWVWQNKDLLFNFELIFSNYYILIKMEKSPKQLHENSLAWRLFNSINFLLGGIQFLVGSILFFPTLTDTKIIDAISIWLFIIGSGNFIVADGMVCLHWILNGKRYIEISCNCIVSILSIACYLIGSVYLLPSMNQLRVGVYLFLAGSYLLCVSEAWKMWRLLRKKDQSFC